ncbi:MAG: sensor histidine kinase [Luteolibacter sp.]
MKTPSRILIVDDNRVNRLVLGRGLETNGFEVIEAESGEKALELLAPELNRQTAESPSPDHIDLVLLDIMMPGMDGNDVLREIRSRKSRSELPVIMATAMDSAEDIIESLSHGANDYITKPVNLPVVIARIETQLSLRATHSALQSAQQSIVRNAKMESINYLAAGVAHEIRNPLARINMTLPMLARSEAVSSDEKLTAAIETVRTSLKKADFIVRGLMQFASENRLKLEPLNIGDLIEETLGIMSSELSGIEVETDFADSLPPALIAREDFSQVLIAVLINAAQASGSGGSITIRTSLAIAENVPPDEGTRSGIRVRNDDEIVLVEIIDSGPGFSQETAEKVFDAFYTTKPADIATGMGLTISRKIMDLHGGLLRVGNRDDGTGARVSIILRKAGSFETAV